MPSPYSDINSRASAALRANPTSLAGLADFDADGGSLRCALDNLSSCLRSNLWTEKSDAGATLFALIRIAQQEYGSGPGYWPHLAGHLGMGVITPFDQRRLGDWFRDALDHFGYRSSVPGQSFLGPILWHAGWASGQLRPFVNFIAAQVAVYGTRAADEDAPHSLRMGLAAKTWNPPLPRTVVRLLEDNAAGIGDLWARVARAVLAARGDMNAVRRTWEPIGGISYEHIVDALRQTQPSLPQRVCPSRPRLRYHADTGEIRLWLTEGEESDWKVESLNLLWQGNSAAVMPPLPERFVLTHLPTNTTWHESFLTGNESAAWFGGRSGALEQGETVLSQGLASGSWHLVCRGAPTGLGEEARCPLAIGYYAGGEGWGAWEITVPERSDGRQFLRLQIEGQLLRFPLARGSAAPLVPTPPVLTGQLADGNPIGLYSGPPQVELGRDASLRLIRRTAGNGDPVEDWDAPEGLSCLPDHGSGVYQLREARGVGRVLLDYAVIAGLGVPNFKVEGGEARLMFRAGSCGRLDGARLTAGCWEIVRPDVQPWVDVTWRWDEPKGLPVRLQWPVQSVRWQLVDPDGPQSPWTREPLAVTRREVAARRLRIRFEVPTSECVLVNGLRPSAEFTQSQTGWDFFLPLDAYAAAESVRLRISAQEHPVVWLSDRPILHDLEVGEDGDSMIVCWSAQFMPTSAALAVWDPTDPAGALATYPLTRDQIQMGCGEWPIPSDMQHRRCAAALGTLTAQGFGPRQFLPAIATDGKPITRLLNQHEDPGSAWIETAHKWTVRHRWDSQPSQRLFADLSRFGDKPPWDDVLRYAARLPATCTLRKALCDMLAGFAREHAAIHVTESEEPDTTLQMWLEVGVHPFWDTLPSQPKPRDTAYPVFYLSRLACLDMHDLPLQERCDAASDVYQFHKSRGLFSPLRGLPADRSAARHVAVSVCGVTSSGQRHDHHLDFVNPTDDLDQFIAQVTGHDACWDVPAAREDLYPRTSRTVARGSAAHYPRTIYEIGWVDESYWCLGRRNESYARCCVSKHPIRVPPWEPQELVGHLGLVEWLLRRSDKMSHPNVFLPNEFDDLLFHSNLGATHRRVLTPPATVEQHLVGNYFIGKRSVSLPQYPDVPPAGKLAWRLAWLDRTVAADRAPIADWTPFRIALATALGQRGAWTELLSECLVVAAYVRLILGGGLGPVFRFTDPRSESTQK